MPAGRPSTYSMETATLICERIADGEGLVAVCDTEGMPVRSTVYLWLNTHKDFSDMYARAVELRVERWSEEILAISDDGINDTMIVGGGDNEREVTNYDVIARSKLRVDTRKWLMSKLLPRKYGERMGLTGADGGPVEFRDVSELEFARRVAFLLATGTKALGDAG